MGVVTSAVLCLQMINHILALFLVVAVSWIILCYHMMMYNGVHVVDQP